MARIIITIPDSFTDEFSKEDEVHIESGLENTIFTQIGRALDINTEKEIMKTDGDIVKAKEKRIFKQNLSKDMIIIVWE